MNSLAFSRSERTAQHLLRPKDEFVRTKNRFHLLDWVACVVGAKQSHIGRIQGAAGKFGGFGESVCDRAAWLGNILEMDDIHRRAILHPGPIIWPAALALPSPDGGDKLDAVLDAAINGYEAMIRIGATWDARHYGYWHTSATAGNFGAAAAAATLLGADQDQMVSALGLAGSVAGGMWQMRREDTMAKQWHMAHAVTTGRHAAIQAMAGVTGPRYILEGPQGLYAATCDAPRPLMLGEGWAVDEVSFKPWAACRHVHPAIDAALELKARGQLVGPVLVETYADALAFCDRPDPCHVTDAKFSLQHVVAVVMQRGAPQLEDFEPDAIAALAEARGHISVVENSALTAAYPDHYGAVVRTPAGEVQLRDTLGDPERPLPADELQQKAKALMMWGGMDAAAAQDAIWAVMETDRRSDIVSFLEKMV